MIHEMRTYRVNLADRPEFLQEFGESLVPLLPEFGLKLLAAWITTIGQHASLDFIWLLEFKDLSHREHAWKGLHADARFKKAAGKLRHYVVDVDVRILEPAGFSPLA